MMAYDAWISFTVAAPPTLSHPENYKEVPCTAALLKQSHPKTWNANSSASDYQCQEGRTNLWVNSKGVELFDSSRLIFDPKEGRVLFEIN